MSSSFTVVTKEEMTEGVRYLYSVLMAHVDGKAQPPAVGFTDADATEFMTMVYNSVRRQRGTEEAKRVLKWVDETVGQYIYGASKTELLN